MVHLEVPENIWFIIDVPLPGNCPWVAHMSVDLLCGQGTWANLSFLLAFCNAQKIETYKVSKRKPKEVREEKMTDVSSHCDLGRG